MNESLSSSHKKLGSDFVFASYKLYKFRESVFKASSSICKTKIINNTYYMAMAIKGLKSYNALKAKFFIGH